MAWSDYYVATGSLGWADTSSGTRDITIDVGTDDNRYLAVAIYDHGNDNTITGITYNGGSLTKSAVDVENTGSPSRVTIWYLANPSSGSNTLTITRSATHEGGIAWVALKSIDLSGGAAPEATNTATGSTTSHALSITTASDDALVISAIVHDTYTSTTLAPNVGTELQDFLAGSGIAQKGGLSGQQAGTAGSQDAGWSSADADTYAVGAIALTTLSADFTQEGFRFRNDNGSETTATWLAAQDTNITAPADTNTRLRVLLDAAGDDPSRQFKLQYQVDGGGYSDVPVGAVTNPGVTFVGSASNTADNGGNVAVDLSSISGLQEGDVVILAHEVADDDNIDFTMTIDTGTGWTKLVDLFSDDSDDTNLAVYYKVMGSTPDTSVTVSGLGGSDSTTLAVASAFRGVDPTTPIDVTTTTATGINTASADPPSISHNGTSGTAVVAVVATGRSGGNTPSYTAPTGYTTNFIQTTANDTTDATLGIAYNLSPSSPEDPGTFVHSSDSVAYSWAAATVALRPISTSNTLYIVTSSNITASGENTTAQLAAPSGKTTGDFDAGRIQDDENPTDTIDVGLDNYTEVEWNLYAASSTFTGGQVITFRVLKDEATLFSYAVTPQWTIGSAGAVEVTPSTAPLTSATFAPTVTATANVSITTAAPDSLSTSLQTPTVTQNTRPTPSTASLNISALAPTVAITDNLTVTPSAASLPTSTYIPTATVTFNVVATPAATSLSTATFAPGVAATGNKTAAPPTATLTAITHTPNAAVTNNFIITPGTAVTTTTTHATAVTATDNITATPGAGALATASFAPLVTTSDPSFAQDAFRFYADGSESGSSALAAENTNVTSNISGGDVDLALRVRLQEGAGGAGSATDDYTLQYEHEDSATWYDVGDGPVSTAASVNSAYDGASGFDPSHTIAAFDTTGANYLLLASFNKNPATEVTDATADTVSMTPVDDNINANVVAVELYGIVPADNSTDIVVSTPSFKEWSGVALAVSDVDPITPYNVTTVKAASYGSTATATITGTAGSTIFIIGATQNDRTLTISGTGATVIQNNSASSSIGSSIVGSVAATGSSQTLGFTLSADDNYALILIEFYPAGSAIVSGFASALLTDGGATTERLSAGSGSYVAGEVSEDGTVDNLQITASNYTELLYSITLNSAELVDTDTLDFRVIRNGSVIDTYTVTPRITVTASANTTLTPSTATQTTTAYTPTVVATDNKAATPPVASLATATFAPTATISVNTTLTSGVASLATATFALILTVTNNVELTPPPASLATAAYAPTVTYTDNVTVAPSTANITTTTYTPTVTTSDNKAGTPTAAALATSTHIPTVTTTDNKTVTPTAASLTTTTHIPGVSVSAGTDLIPVTAAMITSTHAPTVSQSDNITATPTAASLTSATLASNVTITANVTLTPTAAATNITTYIPTAAVTDNQTGTPDTVTITAATFAPFLAVTSNVTLTPVAAVLTTVVSTPNIAVYEDLILPGAGATGVTYVPSGMAAGAVTVAGGLGSGIYTPGDSPGLSISNYSLGDAAAAATFTPGDMI